MLGLIMGRANLCKAHLFKFPDGPWHIIGEFELNAYQSQQSGSNVRWRGWSWNILFSKHAHLLGFILISVECAVSFAESAIPSDQERLLADCCRLAGSIGSSGCMFEKHSSGGSLAFLISLNDEINEGDRRGNR
jgi:hypothetical protein